MIYFLLRKKVFFYTLLFFLFAGGWYFAEGVFSLYISFAQTSNGTSSTFKESLLSQINNLEQEIEENEGKAKGLTKDIDILNNTIKGQELQIRQLSVALSATELEIKNTESTLESVAADIEKNRGLLADNVVLLDEYSQRSMLELFLKNQRLSDFFNSMDQLEDVQTRVANSVSILRDKKLLLEEKQDELEDQGEQYARLHSLEVSQKRSLEQNRSQKNTVLKSTKQQIESKRKNLVALRSQLFYLEKTGVSAEDAVNYATLAATRVGIRPAFLLALLEVETGKAFRDGVISVGTNLGSGNWKRDLYDCLRNQGKYSSAEKQKAAYFEIVNALNYDPDKMPVSARPAYGCGGAMGPAQFLPSTWLTYDDRVAQVTGHNPPDPWKVEDAFTAAALYLADAGATAQTREAERAAAKAYISGSPTCKQSICNVYSSQILSLATAIERNL